MDEFLAISALQHYAYCPRQFALIHVEQVWSENRFTAEGRILHKRVDSAEPEQRGDTRFERSVSVLSNVLGLTGKLDLLEIKSGKTPKYTPVEYKRGKPKTEDWDRIQLCAQALCIEEMRSVQVKEGAIWYWEVRQRVAVEIDLELREATKNIVRNARVLLSQGRTPPPTSHRKRCRACSLADICQPQMFRDDRSSNYITRLFEK
ncbi:CRISPR-associated protein Cas4 [Saccharospirillum salsuginis]|uniref:CRISPR-associated exonuclease Cas4 n=1 Tax=Saccharospirillum salsuginis TaxID=418750 RepID=A0A918KA57_9GAMM|nr:CRISPR-associated protein Cas4 [Saccharospirillum salsuginis]GGX56649.1 CRISPR-associated protein Cas4 [Saccharospirillum salsuginis]